ncbi:uncharacterized protein LOC126603672 [Malus sylvestris]|uniref:uncharacterized protein LOC126603672 n=1 Tax=Malus sylvestris TaxID=3752 RepID=UPI0021ACD5CB|nr:uncharacterized protein LOC126603672 [Malus sylvestris]
MEIFFGKFATKHRRSQFENSSLELRILTRGRKNEDRILDCNFADFVELQPEAGVFHLLPVHSSNPVPVLSPVFKKHSVDGMLTELACLLLQIPFVQCLLIEDVSVLNWKLKY